MKRLIIGTAGHIDHGKTTLVRAITGIETDRLKEEKKRGISIELGFAHFSLPSGQKAAIVDVPGHERFIKHMLAGAFGIDMVILTIAADEGVMPQTREHIDIIELLGINKGVIAITKKDMVDEEWLLLVEEEIREYIADTILRDAPIIAVSSVTGEGIEELLQVIENLAEDVVAKSAAGQARLPIDRVFTMPGFGTVVTGTLWSGQFHVGDIIELMPDKKEIKIRGLQVHNSKVDKAYAGQRVAVNLQGIEVSDVKRGNWLATPGFLNSSYRVDAKLRLIKTTSRVLNNWNRVRFHLGTEEALGRIVLLDREELKAGEEAFAQIIMEKPIVCHKGDPFVIRYYSPVSTIGGGTIIDANAPKQKRFREDVLQELAMKEEGSLYKIILHELESKPEEVLSITEIVKRTAGNEETVQSELDKLVAEKKVVDIGKKVYISTYGLEVIAQKLVETLKNYHRRYPLRAGYPKEDMRSRLFMGINAKTFGLIITYFEQRGLLASKNNLLLLTDHKPQPDENDQKLINKIMENMEKNIFSPPGIAEIREELNINEAYYQEIISYLLDREMLIKVSQDIYFSAVAIKKGKEILSYYFLNEKELNLATARDLFKTTRKYALPLVEYYDRIRFTRRVGDLRVKA